MSKVQGTYAVAEQSCELGQSLAPGHPDARQAKWIIVRRGVAKRGRRCRKVPCPDDRLLGCHVQLAARIAKVEDGMSGARFERELTHRKLIVLRHVPKRR